METETLTTQETKQDIRPLWKNGTGLMDCREFMDEQCRHIFDVQPEKKVLDAAIPKFIIFHVKKPSDPFMTVWADRAETIREINSGDTIVHTVDLSLLSFDWLDRGFRIFINYDTNMVEIYPGMYMPDNREIRKEHNILKLFNAGVFNGLIGIPDNEFSYLLSSTNE